MTNENTPARISRRDLLIGAGAGIALAAPAVLLGAPPPTASGPAAAEKPFELIINGPLVPSRNMLDAETANDWVTVREILYMRTGNILRITFRFNGDPDPKRGIGIRAWAIEADGTEHTIKTTRDAQDPRTLQPTWRFSTLMAVEVPDLHDHTLIPIPGKEVASLRFEFRHFLHRPESPWAAKKKRVD